MIRHTQLVLADPDRGDGHSAAGESGDCLRACVASMLDIVDPATVPNFADVPPGNWHWYVGLRNWARSLGLDVVSARPRWPIPFEGEHLPVVIASGKSPRGDWQHAVLVDAETGELVHDPHPSGAGLGGPIEDVLAIVDLYDPAPDEQVAAWLREEQSS